MGQYKNYFKQRMCDDLKKIMVIATSAYIIDTPLEVNSEGSNGQDGHWQGANLQRSGISLHSWVVFGGGMRPSPLELAQGQQGALGGGEAALFPAVWMSISLFLFLGCFALSSPPRAARPQMLCIHLLRHWMNKGWVLTWGAEELQWGARWFQFLMCMFGLISC